MRACVRARVCVGAGVRECVCARACVSVRAPECFLAVDVSGKEMVYYFLFLARNHLTSYTQPL